MEFLWHVFWAVGGSLDVLFAVSPSTCFGAGFGPDEVEGLQEVCL